MHRLISHEWNFQQHCNAQLMCNSYLLEWHSLCTSTYWHSLFMLWSHPRCQTPSKVKLSSKRTVHLLLVYWLCGPRTTPDSSPIPLTSLTLVLLLFCCISLCFCFLFLSLHFFLSNDFRPLLPFLLGFSSSCFCSVSNFLFCFPLPYSSPFLVHSRKIKL